jgi:hypothetical protein
VQPIPLRRSDNAWLMHRDDFEGVGEGRLLFVNKKKQKNFTTWDSACGYGSATRNRKGSKNSFFQKRTAS